MEDKLANELLLMQEISKVAGGFGVQVRQPFLSPEFVRFAKTIPVGQKIRGPDDLVRKHILRQAALLAGVPEESAMKPRMPASRRESPPSRQYHCAGVRAWSCALAGLAVTWDMATAFPPGHRS